MEAERTLTSTQTSSTSAPQRPSVSIAGAIFALLCLALSTACEDHESRSRPSAQELSPTQAKAQSLVASAVTDEPAKRALGQLSTAAPNPWASREACEVALRERGVAAAGARRAGEAVRVGTWNIRWFPDGKPGNAPQVAGTDIPWLACAIASLDVDILAVQEIKHTPRSQTRTKELIARLDALTGGRWKLELDRCGKSVQQHVGLLYDSSAVSAEGFVQAGAVNPHGRACEKQLRPGLVGRFRAPRDQGGRLLQVMSVHLKSSPKPRSLRLRRASLAGLGREVAQLRRAHPDSTVVIAGDFNTMGCPKCKPSVSAETEVSQLRQSVSKAGLRLLPLVPGCSEYYRGKGGSLDWIAITASAGVSVAEVSGVCAERQCKVLPRGPAPAAFGQLSDHCPVIATLQPARP